MSEKIKIGVLSFAMGHSYPWCDELVKRDDAELVGIWDDNAERGKEGAKRYDTRFFEVKEDLLAICDAVFITPETSKHLEMVEAACKAGCHIMMEKPLAMTVEEGRKMKELVEASGVKFKLNFPKRFDAANMKLAEMVHSGQLGKVFLVRIRHCHHIYLTMGSQTWFAQPEFSGGGALFDEGSHALDQLLWLLGDPESVYGIVSDYALGLECDDTGLAVFRFPNGAIGEVISSGTMVAAEEAVEVYGTKGTAIISGTDIASKPFPRAPMFKYFLFEDDKERGNGWVDSEITPDFVTGFFHQKCTDPFIQYLKGEAEALLSVDEAIKTLDMAEKAYLSAKTHQEIKFDW
ncbi:MAG: Gfo/Idh/MocA family oxidoreductase [Anaerolineaceae bacterium]|nr:Gfo/Idh/MocA family oxidoreductase [Anaerolineaceae bacterium]